MAQIVTREMMTSRKDSLTSGTVNADLHMREIEDFIPIMGRLDTPFLQLIGGTSKQHDKVEIEFGEGDIVGRTVQINGALNDSATTIVVDTPGGNRLQQWDVIKFGDERVLLTEKPSSLTSLANVVRGFGSSTAAAIADNTVGRIMGPAVPEGATAPVSPWKGGVTYINYMQIMEYSFKLTHRARVTPNYEYRTDAFKKRAAIEMKQAALDMHIMAVYGRKNEGDANSTGTNPSATGGLDEFTSTWVADLDSSGTAQPLALSDVIEVLSDIQNDVGRTQAATTVMGTDLTKRIWDSFLSSGKRQYSGKDDVMRTDVDKYQTSLGTLSFTVNYDMEEGELFFVNEKYCERKHYPGGQWSTGVYATDGWYDHGFLRCDQGFRWTGDRCRGKLIDFSYSSADYPNLDVA